MRSVSRGISRRSFVSAVTCAAALPLVACGGGEDEETEFKFLTQPQNVTITVRGSAVGVLFKATVSDTVKDGEWFESRDNGATWQSAGRDAADWLALGFFVSDTSYNGRKYRVTATNYDGKTITSQAATLTVLAGA